MGFQPGHEPFSDWGHVNEALDNDPILRARWLEAKRVQVPWNKGLGREDYPHGIKSGEAHGNWKGVGKARDSAEYRRFRAKILRRDDYTCQSCGARGADARLEVEHRRPLAIAPERLMDESNVYVLCHDCHALTETYGSKIFQWLREQHK
jgi:hypothetical protein